MNQTKTSVKTIGIDGNEANVANRVGSNVFAFELLVALEKVLQGNEQVEVRVFLTQSPSPDFPVSRPGWQYVVVPHQPLWTLWRLPLALLAHRDLTCFFSPGHYLPLWSPVPTACTIMDLAYELYPDYFKKKDLWQLKWLTRWSVRQAKWVFAISQATKRDIVRLYGKPTETITITYPGKNEVLPLQREAVKIFLAGKQLSHYLLFVGTLQPRKNLLRLIEAFEILKQQGYNGKLVLAGKIGWKAEPIVEAMQRSAVGNEIVHLGFVTDQEKTALIQGADVLVLPGLYEGFGLPPLEAMQLGTIPIVSDVSSLPEVVSEEQLRFDPENVASLVQTLNRVLKADSAQKNVWLAKLEKNAAQFNWEATARQVYQVLLGGEK